MCHIPFGPWPVPTDSSPQIEIHRSHQLWAIHSSAGWPCSVLCPACAAEVFDSQCRWMQWTAWQPSAGVQDLITSPERLILEGWLRCLFLIWMKTFSQVLSSVKKRNWGWWMDNGYVTGILFTLAMASRKRNTPIAPPKHRHLDWVCNLKDRSAKAHQGPAGHWVPSPSQRGLRPWDNAISPGKL